MFARNSFPALLLLMMVLALCRAEAEQPYSFESTPGELPKNIVPHRYVIRIVPDLEKFTTKGSVTVDLEVLKPTKEIVLNALDMEVTKAALQGDREIALTPQMNPSKQTVTLSLPKTLEPGKYRLALEFNGRISEQAQGLFYERYQTPSGGKFMLGTQMEPADARRMFPCWDEPVFRAVFELTVVVPSKFKAVSNMPIEHESALAGGSKEVTFAKTPPMASYLVLLAAGELEELEGEAEGVKIRVITTEGKSERGRYALEATKRLLAYYNEYFGIKYPLPKLDQIAIPGGFSGAMENWGAITYSDNDLLYDPQASSRSTQRDIFITVAHEMAHQWFGDLVTTAWWDNLWLNEGFATWMEKKATDHFNPDWELRLTASAEKSAVMSADAGEMTHAIQQPVMNESEANDAFDSVTYDKGGALLRMLEDYLGPEEFRKGIQAYLTARSYSSATTADLWDALERASGKSIRKLAAGWTAQPGLPVVNMKTECAQGRQVVELRQERFTVEDQSTPLMWQIPIALGAAGHAGTVTRFLLMDKSASVTLADCGGVLKANAGDTGYYRVSYSPELFARLLPDLKLFPAIDRLNLLQDCWAMVEGRRISAVNYFALVSALNDEHTFAIWDQIINTLYLIDTLEQNQPGRGAWREYCCALLRPQFERLGWKPKPGEPANDPLLRGKVLTALGQFGDRTVITEAKERFEQFLAKPETLDPDLRPAVVKIVGRYSDQWLYNQIHALAIKASSSEERRLYYESLATALDEGLARETLALSLTNELAPEEAAELVPEVAGLGEHQELAWEFTKQHFRDLLAKVDSFSHNDYVPSIFGTFSDAARADELEAYVKKNVSDDALARARETAEGIRTRARLKQRALPVIEAWVKKQSLQGTK